MKKIALNLGYSVLVDDEDFSVVNQYSWFYNYCGKYGYARTRIIINNTRKYLLMQTLIMGNAPKGKKLYFKDGNRLNLQKENLEFISNSVAAHKSYIKRGRNKNAETDFRGIVVQYIARIKINNRVVILGTFSSEKEAAIAYNNKAKEIYGEKACVNRIY